MAENKGSAGRDVSRRGFLGAIGLTAAASAGAVELAFPWGKDRPVLVAGWADELRATLGTLRASYMAEVERLAVSLEPRFRSGELRGTRSPEDDRKRIPGTTGWGDECFTSDPTPADVLEGLCADRFGLHVTQREDDGKVWIEGDREAAHVILALSPRAEPLGEGDWQHPCYHARAAAAWDVLAVARARRWYTPTKDESEDPAIETWCEDCGHRMSHHEEDGCHAGDCTCKVRHVAHVPGPAPEVRS